MMLQQLPYHCDTQVVDGNMSGNLIPPSERTRRLANVSDYCMPGEHKYKGITYSENVTPDNIERTRNVQFNKDDVIVASYPKTGTTLTLEIAWLVLHEADVEGAKQEYNYYRVPFSEICSTDLKAASGVDLFKTMASPRMMKTHLPWQISPKGITEQGTKTIYIMRNPKDALVSFYYFYCSTKTFGYFPGTWSDFFLLFLQDRLFGGNIFDHYLGYWNERHRKNILFLKYEDILRNHTTIVGRVANFLGKELTSKQIDNIVEATTFINMKQNDMTNFSSAKEVNSAISPFMRKGQIGDWQNHFTYEENSIMDKLIEKRLESSGLIFDYV